MIRVSKPVTPADCSANVASAVAYPSARVSLSVLSIRLLYPVTPCSIPRQAAARQTRRQWSLTLLHGEEVGHKARCPEPAELVQQRDVAVLTLKIRAQSLYALSNLRRRGVTLWRGTDR